jgi:hypothetical protein
MLSLGGCPRGQCAKSCRQEERRKSGDSQWPLPANQPLFHPLVRVGPCRAPYEATEATAPCPYRLPVLSVSLPAPPSTCLVWLSQFVSPPSGPFANSTNHATATCSRSPVRTSSYPFMPQATAPFDATCPEHKEGAIPNSDACLLTPPSHTLSKKTICPLR